MAGFELKKASKKQAKLRMAIGGPPGAGKTYTAIKLAKHLIGEPYKLADGQDSQIVVIDTERSSAELYQDEFDFLHGDLAPDLWNPKMFSAALRKSEKVAKVVILDSITHEWKWCLGQVEILKPKYKGNTWSTWSEIRPPHDDFIDSIMGSSAHVIATMRSKMATEMVESNGRKEVKQLGMEAIQEAELDYAFTVVLDMDRDKHSAVVRKTRCGAIDGKAFPMPGEDLANVLLTWLNSGEAVQPERPKEVVNYLSIAAELESKLKEAEYELDQAKVDKLSNEYSPQFKGVVPDIRSKVGELFKTTRANIAAAVEAQKVA